MIQFTKRCQTQDWAFTVKILRNPKSATSSHYDVWFDHAKHFVNVFKCIPETTNGILHFHGMYSCCSSFYRKNLCLYNFHVKFVRIYNQLGWDKYCNKMVTTESRPLMKCLFKRDANFKFIV